MKYFITIIRRNPQEVFLKIWRLLREKVIGKNKNSKRVVIYSLGKAGTSSIYESMRYSKQLNVLHLHYLGSQGTQIDKWRFLENRRSKKARDWFRQGDVLVVALVRDPFSRSISSFVQNYELYHVDCTLDEAVIKNAQTISLDWWDQEFKRTMNWDVYAHSFNKNSGISEYEMGENQLVIVKSTVISSSGISFLSKKLGVHLSDTKANLSRTKKAAKQFHSRLEDFKFPKETFESIAKSKFVRHFYTDNEIEGFQRQWQKAE
jgi:hypothetical protein